MRTAAVTALLLACMSASTAHAQETPTVRAIEIRNIGPGRVDESFVRAHIRAREGSPLDRTAIAQDVRAILDTQRFAYADVKAEPHPEGLRLVYSVRHKLQMDGPLRVEGAARFSERRIRDWVGLEPGDLVDEQSLASHARKVLERYKEKSYPNAALSWNLEETDRREGLARVTLTVNEGTPLRMGSICFEGNASIPNRQLSKAARQPARWNPFRVFFKKRRDAAELEAARMGVRHLYLDRGFLDVAVAPPRAELDTRGRRITVLTVREGPCYRFGDITLSGVDTFPEAEVNAAISTHPGNIAGAAAIRNSTLAVRNYYGSRGYINTLVRPEVDADPDTGIASVHFHVTEGELVSIHNIHIRGNTRTRDKVIRRELLVYPGDIYNEVKVGRSERRVQNLGFFETVRAHPESTTAADRVDLAFEVEEKRTGQFLVGAGFSSVENAIGFVELSQGNFDLQGWPYFTGGGQKLKLRGQFGSVSKNFEISFVEPWFLNRKLSLGFDLYRSEIDYSDYELQRTGFAISLGKALPGPNRIQLRYRLQNNVIRDVADTNRYVYADSPTEAYFFDREEDSMSSSLTVTLTHDTRDNPFVPTRGKRISLFGEITGGALGFDVDLYSMGTRAVKYVPLWYGHVLSFHGRYEVVEAFGDTDEVPITDRLFIGGGRTLRGFDYRDVGPKAIRDVDVGGGSQVYHRPVGGQSLAMASAEYTIPLVSAVRFAGFYDIGNVWRDAYRFETEGLASSAGVGIRLDMPGFPIRIDRAWVINKDSDLTDEDTWVFWIGYDY